MKPTATPASISLKKRLKIEENIKAWNCICNAYNCNKLSRDVYLYQITLENGLKCLHKFRYKSFNIGSWSLFPADAGSGSPGPKSRVHQNQKMLRCEGQ